MNRRIETSMHGSRGFGGGAVALLALFALTAAAVAWVGMGIVAKERWPIRWLELSGSFQRVSAEQLRASLSPRLGSSFFTIDLQGLHDAAAKNSWVSVVQVQKQWPDTVRVIVAEYEPVAHWNRGQLLSRDGRLFAVPEADSIQGLPWLTGPDERLEEVVGAWREFNERLASMGLEVDQLQLDRRGAWSMTLNNGTHVQLGRGDTDARLTRLLASWESLVRQREAAPLDVDMRYTNGFAVLWPQPPVGETKAGS